MRFRLETEASERVCLLMRLELFNVMDMIFKCLFVAEKPGVLEIVRIKQCVLVDFTVLIAISEVNNGMFISRYGVCWCSPYTT